MNSSRLQELPKKEMDAIIKDYADKGIVITEEQVLDQINQLVEIMKQAHREGLLIPAIKEAEEHLANCPESPCPHVVQA